MVKNSIAIDVCMEPVAGQMELADCPASVQVDRLNAFLHREGPVQCLFSVPKEQPTKHGRIKGGKEINPLQPSDYVPPCVLPGR